jgi:localization factor PodJL
VREAAPLPKPEPRASEFAPPSTPAFPDTEAAPADRTALFREPKSTPTPLAKSYAEPVGSGSEVQVLQITPAAPQPAVTGAADSASSSDRIANVASLGDIPSAGVPAGLRQAALAGEPTAVYELASRLADGRGAPRDPKLAAKLFERAALHGLAPAQYRVGSHYEKGFGVGRDLTLAKLWYQRAAEKGNARAMHNLGVLLADGTGGRADYAGAAGWFRRAAELGVRDSQFNLAVLLARGLGTGQDLAQAYTWFAIAAAQGDPDSGKKRDEVAARLGPHDAAAAQAAAERWRAETPDKAANEVAPAPQSWTEAPAPKRGAGTGRG